LTVTGRISAYYAANMEIACEKSSFSLDGRWPILTEAHNSLPPEVIQGGSLQNSLVSPGCVVKGHVENSILSPGVCVEERAVVKNSVLMSGVRVGYCSVVDHSILDEAVDVSKFCFIGFRAGIPSGDSNITVLGRGLIIPPHTAIGCNGKVLTRVGWKLAHSGTAISPQPESTTMTEEKIAVSELR
jgi:glucose-1-phosphate adenylyltransferase